MKVNFLELLALHKAKIILVIIIVAGGYGLWQWFGAPKQSKTTYITSQASRDTLVVSISGTGTITSGNYTNITTKASGTVSKLYVNNGDVVAKGQKMVIIGRAYFG